MKQSPFLYVAITTLLLVTITIMSAMGFPFNWVFYLTVIGQVFIVIMVYKVLTDNYTTSKTFEHFYEDCPIEPLEVRAENETFR
jgi:TRAP-type C4-dicarboxylate transport system permease small subunit